MIHMTRLALVVLLLFILASPAMAYIGPGAGLSLLGALWGLVAAVGAALLFILIWPFRRMLRRKREAKQAEAMPKQEAQQTTQQNQQEGETTAHHTAAHQASAHDTSVDKTTAQDPNTSTEYKTAEHDDEKKPSDVGTR